MVKMAKKHYIIFACILSAATVCTIALPGEVLQGDITASA